MEILKFKKVNCKNCYKCIRHCPVKSIEIKNHQAQIIKDDCILCGNCTVVCPQNAKEASNDVPIIKGLIRDGKNVIATIAPSYVANYSVDSFEKIKEILMKLGFSDAYETAEGAYLVKSEYERLVEEKYSSVIISSACPTIVKYIRRYKPELIPNLAPIISPMQASSKIIKEKYSDSIVVFIGPCISKKMECTYENSDTNYAITYEELTEWLNEYDISIPEYNATKDEHKVNEVDKDNQKYKSRLFPVKGGIIETMKKNAEYDYIAVDGFDNCSIAIKEILSGKLSNCFIEMSACIGSCIGGPDFRKNNLSVISSELSVRKNAEDGEFQNDFNIENHYQLGTHIESEQVIYAEPSQKQIMSILKKMGKNSEDDELNCGSCGYATCRDKAIAVFYGKAEISMCLPFMKERAESFSDKIINITPNAVIAVDMDLKVQQINKAACDMFGISDEKDIKNCPVSGILDEFDFINMITQEKTKMKKNSYLTEYNLYLEQVFLYDKNNGLVICILHDITAEKRRRNKLMDEKIKAANMADDIVEKQLRIVHEIASLLGETAAETKIAVNDLKDKILLEEKDNNYL